MRLDHEAQTGHGLLQRGRAEEASAGTSAVNGWRLSPQQAVNTQHPPEPWQQLGQGAVSADAGQVRAQAVGGGIRRQRPVLAPSGGQLRLLGGTEGAAPHVLEAGDEGAELGARGQGTQLEPRPRRP